MKRRVWIPIAFSLLGVAFWGGYRFYEMRGIRVPDLGGLYNRSAQEEFSRKPLIVLPGILGSKLADDDSIVWGAFDRTYADPNTPDGARRIAPPMGLGTRLEDLVDDVQSAGALDVVRLRVLGVHVSVHAYAQILGALGVAGYRDQHLGKAGAIDYGDNETYTCFQFDYDFRRDLVETVREFHKLILDRRDQLLEEARGRGIEGEWDQRFNVVAHSMGGLVIRYYLRYGPADLPEDGLLPEVTWEGARHIHRVFLVGTPSFGSVDSVTQLLEGYKPGPLLPHYDKAILGAFPSIYQLLPRPRMGQVECATPAGGSAVDVYDLATWKRFGWGLADPDNDRLLEWLLPDAASAEERLKIALDHLEKCLRRAKQFAAAMDQPAVRPDGLDLYLFLGDAIPTAKKLEWNDDTRTLRTIETAPGDGIVLRSSALGDERVGGDWTPQLRTPIPWSDVTFVFKDHLGITCDPGFVDGLLYRLLEEPN